jgi:ribosome-associated heat shock protein Hsp15
VVQRSLGQALAFGECGGVSTAEVSKIVDTQGLTNVTNNSSGCEWVTSADQLRIRPRR